MSDYISLQRISSSKAEVVFRGVYFTFELPTDKAVTSSCLHEDIGKRKRLHMRSGDTISVPDNVIAAVRRAAFDAILAHRAKMRLPRPKPKIVKPRPFQPPLPLG